MSKMIPQYNYRLRIVLHEGEDIKLRWNHTMLYNEGEEEYPRYQFNSHIRDLENFSCLFFIREDYLGRRMHKIKKERIKEILLERCLRSPEEYMHDIIKDL